METSNNTKPGGLRRIQTARDRDSINAAARNGFWPLVKKVEPSAKIFTKYTVMQNIKTGEIEVTGDYRGGPHPARDYVTVVDWSTYYPHCFKSPYAAYLIPKDIEPGERVILEDLIEDYVGMRWDQGGSFRLASCEAIWNGTDMEIQYDPLKNCCEIMG